VSRIPRSVVLERLAYVTAAPVLAAVPNIVPDGTADIVLKLGTAAVSVIGGVVAANADEGKGRKIVRLSPVVTALAIDIAAVNTTSWYWDALMAAGWAAVGWLVLPWSKSARSRHRPALAHTPPPQLAAAQPAPAPARKAAVDPDTDQIQAMWEHAGSPADTVVDRVIPHPGTTNDMTLMLRAARPGRPITGLTQAAVAAAFMVDETDVEILPVAKQDNRPGGPGWAEVRVTPDAARQRTAKPTRAQWWADTVARDRGAIPGSTFVSRQRDDKRGVTYWIASMDDPAAEPVINPSALCTALKVPFEDGRVFTFEDGSNIMVMVWDISPLARIYPATRELLTPDSEGRYIVGYLANGQPARGRVHTDRGAAHGLIAAPSGGGKTQLMTLFVAADANAGAVVWLVAEGVDEKTATLGKHVDRQGFGALYMVRALRAVVALMDIRGRMPWADGQPRDWSPKRPGCPYRLLSLYLDEYLTAARDADYGDEIMELAETASVKGRKYAIGEKVVGQSVEVQDGFTRLLCDNLRENSIPVVLKVAAPKMKAMFSALGIEDVPEPLPRTFTSAPAGRFERIMNGEPEPASDDNTGGVGWIIEGKTPEVLRTLFADYDKGIGHLFPDQIHGLTEHEITELEKLGLWFDWNLPPQPGEFGPEPDDEDGYGEYDDEGWPGSGAPINSTQDALDAIKELTGG